MKVLNQIVYQTDKGRELIKVIGDGSFHVSIALANLTELQELRDAAQSIIDAHAPEQNQSREEA